MTAKQPFAAVVKGIFQPTTSDEEVEQIQTWIGEQHTLFLSLERIHQEALKERQHGLSSKVEYDGDEGPPPSQMAYYTRLMELVVQANRDLLAQMSSQAQTTPAAATASSSRSPSPSSSQRFQQHISGTSLPILTLFQTLYASPNALEAQGQGIVGEELLHWLNSYDLAPTTEQGREIASSAEPHLHPTFWDYILRCTLRGFHSTVSTLLATVLNMPSSALVRLIEQIRELVKGLPRSINYKTEVQFKAARRDFHLKLVTILTSLEGVMDEVQDQLDESYDSEEEAEDLRLSLEAGLRVFLEVLAGNKERVVEAAEDWKEALAAWATLVDVGLQRSGLGDALAKIKSLRQDTFGDEGDAWSQEEPPQEQIMIQCIKGEVLQACQALLAVDPYLAQVLSDFSSKLGVITGEDSKANGTSAPTQLEAANLVYANTLLSTYGLWRMSLDYLAQAGIRGRAKMSQVVLGVPLLEDPEERISVPNPANEARNGEDEESMPVVRTDEFHLVKSVLEACDTYGLSKEAKAVCRKVSLHLSSASASTSPRYGASIVFALRSPPRGDITVVKLVQQRVLDELVQRRGSGIKEAKQSRAAEAWFVNVVREIKRWIMKAQREQQEEATAMQSGSKDQGAPQPRGPFLSQQRRFGGADQDEEALLDDEEDWNLQFGNILPAPVLLLTNLARYFRLKAHALDDASAHGSSATSVASAAAAFMVELLNSGLLEGSWNAIALHEISSFLPSPLGSTRPSAMLDATLLYDVLRILESVLFDASLGSGEEAFSLGSLAVWLGASTKIDGDNQTGAAQTAIRAARQDLGLLRYKVALAIGIPAQGPRDVDAGVLLSGGIEAQGHGQTAIFADTLLNQAAEEGQQDAAMEHATEGRSLWNERDQSEADEDAVIV